LSLNKKLDIKIFNNLLQNTKIILCAFQKFLHHIFSGVRTSKMNKIKEDIFEIPISIDEIPRNEIVFGEV
jgi:hypothetical protein